MITAVLLSLYLFVASAMDLCWRRVSNYWILYGLVSGFFFSFVDAGLFGGGGFGLGMGSPGIAGSLQGLIFSLPFMVLYAFRLLGAGDVKLLMVVGSFLGGRALYRCLPLMVIAAGFSALIFLKEKNKEMRNGFHLMPMAPSICLGLVMYSALMSS